GRASVGVRRLEVALDDARAAGPQRLPPPAVRPVPFDRCGERRLERPARMPPERAHLRRVDGLAPVVSGPVGHVRDERLRLPTQPQDAAGQLEVRELVAGADVVDGAWRALPEHEVEGRAVVLDVYPV